MYRINVDNKGITLVRLESGDWDNFDSLKSRIMVAAGGGSTYNSSEGARYGGSGGALEGIDGTDLAEATGYARITYIGESQQ